MISNKQTKSNNKKQKFSAECIAACRELYLQGLSGRAIETAMRSLGWHDFNVRILYSRRKGRGVRPGWIREFGWSRNVDPKAGTAPNGDDFVSWLKDTFPDMTWDWKFQKLIYEKLERVSKGECKRLMISIPPRHGKTELLVRYIAWRLLKKPETNVIVASYGQKLADRLSRKVRQAICDGVAKAKKPVAAAADEAGQNQPVSEANFRRRATSFRCAACRAAAAASQGERRDTIRHRDAGDHACRASEVLDINECSKCGAPLEARTSVAAMHDSERVDRSGRDSGVRMFPFTSAKPANTISEWGTAAGGGLKAVGVGAGVTGFGADLVIIDDPIKSRAEAESETYRERLWDWYNSDLYTRLEPEASIILVQTRWHEDDLAGRLLKQKQEGGEEWEVLRLPALREFGVDEASEETGELRSAPLTEATEIITRTEAEARGTGLDTETNSAPERIARTARVAAPLRVTEDALAIPAVPPPRSRIIGYPRLYSRLPSTTVSVADASADVAVDDPRREETEDTPPRATETIEGLESPLSALCPERFDVPKLVDLKKQLGTYDFSALYQQEPTPAEGALFKREWLRHIVDQAPPGLQWFRGYDLAISTRTTADYTASVRVAVDEMGVMYIADCIRRRIEFPEQRRLITERILAERDTRHGVENSVHARAIVQDIRRDRILMRSPLQLVEIVGDKTTRALIWSPRAEEGKLRLVRGPWNDDFVEELIRFPKGVHDDQIDAVSVAVAMMGTGEDKRLFTF